MKIISTLILAASLSACASSPVANISKQPLDGGCVAMRPHFPIQFHGSNDAPDTVARIRTANAAFKAACP